MAICAANDLPDPPYTDGAFVGPGEARYWLVKACNACNTGNCTFRRQRDRADPRDALDASPPCP